MQKRKKNLLSVFGIILGVIGLFMAVPSYLNSTYLGLGISSCLVIIGIVLLALAYGD